MAQLNLDLHQFFSSIRPLFGNLLTQGQVNGMQYILTAWEATDETDIRWLAYELATTWWETAKTMQPIEEFGRGAGHPYGVVDGTGKAPYGRGDVQLTWRSNYVTMDAALGLKGALASNYDLALDPAVAAKIMFVGMEKGLFTGHKLSDYINSTKCDYFHARQIINNLDQAQKIADAAHAFEVALHASITAFVPATGPTPQVGFWTRLLQAIEQIFAALKPHL